MRARWSGNEAHQRREIKSEGNGHEEQWMITALYDKKHKYGKIIIVHMKTFKHLNK